MLSISGDELREEFQEGDLGLGLMYLLNPLGAIGSVVGETEGIFGMREWEGYTASKVAAISASVAVLNEDRVSGESFYQRIIDYVKSAVGEITDAELQAAEDSAGRVSFCHNAATGKATIYHQLKENGFFERLKPAYTTLEILTAMVIEDETSLPIESLDGLKGYLHAQFEKYTAEVAAGREGRNFQIKLYQLNKYKALLDSLAQSHAQALELLSDLDIERVKQTIRDKQIRYRKVI